MAVLDAENGELALAAARERLAALETRAEVERLDRERLEALALCDQRRAAAQRVDEAFADLGEAMAAWQATVAPLERYGRRGQDWLHHIECNGREALPGAMTLALGYDLARAFGLLHYPGPEELLPLADADPVLLHARRQRGEDVDTRAPQYRSGAHRTPVLVAHADPDDEAA
jgi:hypothetical protein